MTPPRRIFIELLAVAIALVVGVAFGRLGAPVREQTRIATVEVARLQEVLHLVNWVEAVKVERQRGIQNTRKVTHPDGTIVEEGQIVWDNSTREETRQRLSLNLQRTEARESRREEEHIVQRDGARLNLFGGVGVSSSLTAFDPALLVQGGLSYQVFGPGTVGATVSYEHGAKPRIGLVFTAGLRL